MKCLTHRIARSETAGEASLATIADHLERGALPPAEAVDVLVKAVDAMLNSSDAEMRRLALLQGMGLYQAQGNPNQTTDEPARLYWFKRHLEGMKKMKAREAVAEILDCDPKTVENNVKRYPDAEARVLEILRLHGKLENNP